MSLQRPDLTTPLDPTDPATGPTGRAARAAGPRPRPAGARTATVSAALRWGAGRLSFVEDEVAGLRQVVAPGATCLDIGAEYGLYTWTLSALVGPTGAVHSVEPLPGPARWLRTTARLLGARNVAVHRLALGAEPGRGTLSLPKRRGLPVHGRTYLTEGTDGPGPNAEFASSVRVPARVATLDQLADELRLTRTSFVKADVEGAELAVLRGGAATLRRHRPTLLLEIEDRHLRKYGARAADVPRHLEQYGYRAHRWWRGRWVPAPRITEDCRNYLFTV
ncbi:FkbM family methyltransferase [Kitasatospora sp. NPDC089797]|uniref:FkbM family methyltransferase n=1 Tax=Kitasatospora sp. NPDC089797 TaxID=3155298 RepID=UPI0034219DF3